VRKLLARVQTGDRVANYETVRVRKDGASVEVSLAISPIRDQGGAVVGASTVVREIGELRRAVEALRRSEESYRLLFERHPNPMWLYDPKTLRFLAVNEAAIEVYGYSREEFLAMTIEKIRPVEDRTVLHEALDNLPSGYSGGEVFQHQKKDGTLIDVTISANAFEFEGRRARLVLSQDVTERRRLEAQLLQAQKMEAIGSLAGGIAHDFNNLLLVIRGYCAVLSNRPSDEELRESTEQIDIAALRAAELTHQLLAFSSQQMLRPEVTDLNAVVEETLKLLRRTLRRRHDRRVGARSDHRFDLCRQRSADTGRAQPGDQRPRRDGGQGRHDRDPDFGRPPRRDPCVYLRRCRPRVIRPSRDFGLRKRHGRSDAAPCV